MTVRRPVLRGFLMLSLCFLFLWPAVMNHGPFYFIDTRTYIRTEDAALSRVLHTRTDWTADDSAPSPPSRQSYLALHNMGEAHSRSLSEIKQKGIVVGRSLFWGLLPYAGWRSGFWLTIFLQSASLVLLLWLCLRTLDVPVWRCILPVSVLLASLSDAGFYASYLMPDIYAGFAVVAVAFLLSANLSISRRLCWLWFLILTWCLLAHDSLILLGAACLCVAIAVNLFSKSWKNRAGLLVLAISVFLSIVVQQGVAIGIQRATGQEPLRFPLITARLIEDGPGTSYIRKSCPASGFAVCSYADKVPMSGADFLFCTVPKCSAYEVAEYEQRLRISHEQTRFLVAVFRDDPAGVVKAGLRDTWEELFNLSMGPFSYPAGIKRGMDLTFPQSALLQIHGSAAYRGKWPVGLATFLVFLVTGLSFAYVVLNSLRLLPGRDKHSVIVPLGLWCCVGVLMNAAICGALSEPSIGESRYQGRVVWVLPLVVLLSEAIYFLRKEKFVSTATVPKDELDPRKTTYVLGR